MSGKLVCEARETRLLRRGNSSVEAWGNSSVVAWGNSSVEARENSSVVARENSSVEARGNSSVVARENSSVVARDNSSVQACGNSSVVARETRLLRRMKTRLLRRGETRLLRRGKSRLLRRGKTRLLRRGETRLFWRMGNSSVVAWGNSSVEARGSSVVRLFSAIAKVTLAGYSFCYVMVKGTVDKKSDTANIIEPKVHQVIEAGCKMKVSKKIMEMLSCSSGYLSISRPKRALPMKRFGTSAKHWNILRGRHSMKNVELESFMLVRVLTFATNSAPRMAISISRSRSTSKICMPGQLIT